jgi:cytochrome c oxidase assembly protein subunit 15
MEGGVFYEHGHRIIAATVGFLTIVLAVWLWREAHEPLLKMAGWIALALVCAQGVLGGVTVLLRLPAVTSVGHACLGQIFFAWIACIAAMTWSSRLLTVNAEVPKLRRLAMMTTGFVLFQLVFGAIYRHTGLMLHVHFLGAALVFIHVILLFRRIQKIAIEDVWLTRPAVLLSALVFAQIGLGISAWLHPTILDATTHVAVGSLILATASVITLESYRRVTV